MLHRIREAMKTDALVATMIGVIVADETWIGDDPGNRHQRTQNPINVTRTDAHNAKTDKQAVVSIINAHTGDVRSESSPTLAVPRSVRSWPSRSIFRVRFSGRTAGRVTARSAPSSWPTGG